MSDSSLTFGTLHQAGTARRYQRRIFHTKRDELASSHHSITSSAVASSVGGTSRRSAFAVLRLMNSSSLVA